MSKLVSNYTANGSSTTDEYGTFVVLNRFIQGDVVEGFAVVANSSPNMTVYVQPGSGRITTGTYPSSYGYLISHDTSGQGEAVTIATANASARIDYVVAYIDKAVAGSTLGANVNNTNNVLKFASVAGTPSGSPVVPTVAQIQTAIGAANPYIILAQIAVGISVSTITNANITDKRNFISAVNGTSGTLGYAQITSNFNTTSTSNVQVTGLSVPVTIPNGGRRLKITFWSAYVDNSTSAFCNLGIWDGAVGSGTQLATLSIDIQAVNTRQIPATMISSILPPSGSKTYNVGISVTSGTGTIYAATTSPAFLLVELI